MSRFNFLNPTTPVATTETTATVQITHGGASVTANRNKKAKRALGEDDVGVLASLPNGTELRENRTRRGLEIKFDRKPDDTTLAVLKTGGGSATWRWSRFSGVWYAPDTAANRAWARTFLTNLTDGAPAATPQMPTASTTAAAPIAEITPAPVAPAPSVPSDAELAKHLLSSRSAILPKRTIIIDNPPPGGWKESDRVAPASRLPQRPKPFLKP